MEEVARKRMGPNRVAVRRAVFGGLILLGVAGFLASREAGNPGSQSVLGSAGADRGVAADQIPPSSEEREVGKFAVTNQDPRMKKDLRRVLADGTMELPSKEAMRRSRELAREAIDRRLATQRSYAGESGTIWVEREDLEVVSRQQARELGHTKEDGTVLIGGFAIVPVEASGRKSGSSAPVAVQEARTGRLGMLTGSLVVRLRDWSERDAFLSRHPATVVGEAQGIRMVVLRPAAGVDLSDFADVVRADPSVLSATIEVIDHRLEPK